MVELIHEYNIKGTQHRLRFDTTGGRSSPWVGYCSPAVIPANGSARPALLAVTDYYEGSMEFPDPNKVYIVAECENHKMTVVQLTE